MMLLEETRKLVLPPASNLPLGVDRSWASLLAGNGVVGIVGAVEPGAEDAVTYFCDAVVRDPDDGARLTGMLVGEGSAPRAAALAEQNPEATVVVVPGADAAAVARRWLFIEDRLRSGGLPNRVRRAGDLILGRVASRVGVVPRRLRGHASDVDYLTVPQDLEGAVAADRLSVGLASSAPPDYLAAASKAAGWDIDDDSWSFGRPRGFASQKIVFRLASGGRPFIVKMTQHPRFNARLEAEARATERWAAGDDPPFIVAEPILSTVQGGLRMIGQALLEGRPFRMTADPDPSDPVIEAGFRAVIELGARSAEPTTADERAGALGQLRNDFLAIFDTPPAAAAELDRVVDRLTRTAFPAVFMHGDFAAWNLLAEPNGSVGVLDWENADPRGVPLWDLFVYTRTVGKFLADAAGIRYSGSVFRRQFFEPTSLRLALEAHVDAYCRAVGVPIEAVDDLFTMCWVQQAVREAATLAAPGWDTAQSTRFLTVALERPLGIGQPIR